MISSNAFGIILHHNMVADLEGAVVSLCVTILGNMGIMVITTTSTAV